MGMSKDGVKRIGNRARRIMLANFKHGTENVVNKLNLKKISLPYTYFYIFEDANFHSLNRILVQRGIFKSDKNNAEYNSYRKAGGKTWQLT